MYHVCLQLSSNFAASYLPAGEGLEQYWNKSWGKAQLFGRFLWFFCLGTFSLWCWIKKQLWDQHILDWVAGLYPAGQLDFSLKKLVLLVWTWFFVVFKCMIQLVAEFLTVKYFLLKNIEKEGKQLPNDCFKPNETCEQHGSCWNEIAN